MQIEGLGEDVLSSEGAAEIDTEHYQDGAAPRSHCNAYGRYEVAD